MRVSRTISALTIVLAALFLQGSNCVNLDLSGPFPGTPCSPAGTLECNVSFSSDYSFEIKRCDGQNGWVLEKFCPTPTIYCAKTAKGVGCYDCPYEGATTCGTWPVEPVDGRPRGWPFDDVLTCVWRDSDATLQWQVKTDCHDQSPTSMCWSDSPWVGPTDPSARCLEIEGNCPFDRTDPVTPMDCHGDTLVTCWPPTVDGGVVVFNWVPSSCPSGTACRMVSGRATCAPVGIGGDADAGV